MRKRWPTTASERTAVTPLVKPDYCHYRRGSPRRRLARRRRVRDGRRVLPLESPDGADLLAAALDVDPARDREAIVDLFRGLDLEGAADDDGRLRE